MNFIDLTYDQIQKLSNDELRTIANVSGISHLIKIEVVVKKTKCGGEKYSEVIVGTEENIVKYKYIICRLKRMKTKS